MTDVTQKHWLAARVSEIEAKASPDVHAGTIGLEEHPGYIVLYSGLIRFYVTNYEQALAWDERAKFIYPIARPLPRTNAESFPYCQHHQKPLHRHRDCEPCTIEARLKRLEAAAGIEHSP